MAPSQPIILDDPKHGVLYSQSKDWRELMKIKLATAQWQITIIALVILDACLVR
jgi:hypothetical protein